MESGATCLGTQGTTVVPNTLQANFIWQQGDPQNWSVTADVLFEALELHENLQDYNPDPPCPEGPPTWAPSTSITLSNPQIHNGADVAVAGIPATNMSLLWLTVGFPHWPPFNNHTNSPNQTLRTENKYNNWNFADQSDQTLYTWQVDPTDDDTKVIKVRADISCSFAAEAKEIVVGSCLKARCVLVTEIQ